MTDDDLSDLAWAAEDDGDEDLDAWADSITDHLTIQPEGTTMPTTTVEIDANPSPAAIHLVRSILAHNGVDPDNRQTVMSLATYGVSPLDVVTAAAQLAITFDCPMKCGRKLDPANKDAMGVDLCPTCYDEAGLENEHSDGYHEEEPDPDCPDCRSAQ